MMMCDLPLELVEEILSRVPATSLKRLRSTCKRWNALFKDQRFSEKHFLKAPKESKVLILKEYKVFSMSVNFNVAPPSIEFKAGGLKASHFNIGAVFHCDGLLLCITLDNRAVVWNPCLGETRWIQRKSSSYSRFALGYEKEKSGHSYKILMYRESHNDIPRKRANGFEIYEFSSDSWRLLDNVALDCTPPSNIVVSLKGNSYWLAYDKKEKYNHFLLCFDFTAERFKRMCLPPSDVDQMSLSVVGEKQLSVLALSNSTSEMEIWITNKIDTDIEVELKWSKSFAVDIPNDCCVYYPRGLSFLIDEEKKVALCCYRSVEIGKNIASIIGEDDEYYREILDEYSKFSWFPYIFSYIPSLVQIQLS